MNINDLYSVFDANNSKSISIRYILDVNGNKILTPNINNTPTFTLDVALNTLTYLENNIVQTQIPSNLIDKIIFSGALGSQSKTSNTDSYSSNTGNS